MKTRLLLILSVIIFIFCLFPAFLWAGEFAIPASRYVSLAGKCGLDAAGGIPSSGWTNCVTADCNTLWGTAPGSITAAMINDALTSAAGSNTVIRVPAGAISITGDITLVSQTVLRGQGTGVSGTTIDLNGNQVLMTQTLVCDGTALGSCATRIDVDNEPVSKGSTTMSLDHTDGDFAGTVVENAVCLVFQNNPSYVSVGSEASWTGWEPDTTHNVGHWVKIATVNGTNGDVAFDPPLLMDLENGQDPEILCIPQADWLYRAGIEDIKFMDGGNAIGMILIKGCNECWIDGIETYNAGNSSGSAHIRTERQGNFRVEVRDSFFHTGESPPYDSGENYAGLLMGFNSFWKVENNIFHDLRHTWVYEGPSAGMAFLYNYDRSVRTEDPTFLGQFVLNSHAYHPLNNLFEGNITGVMGSDYQFGSSSNAMWFRNWARCNKPDYSFDWGIWAVDIWQWKLYYNFVGNILGSDSVFDPGDYYENDATAEMGRDAVWQLGSTSSDYSSYNSNTKAALLRHMNYDYVNEGTRTCDQEGEGCQGATSTDTDLPDSLYYTSKPSFLASGDNWPLFDVTKAPNMLNVVSGTAYYNPAYRRYEELGDPPSTTPPSVTGCTIKSTSGNKIRTGGGGVQLRLQ